MNTTPDSAQVPAGRVGRLRWLPYIASFATLATAVPLAWDKGFDTVVFLILVYLPGAGVVCLALFAWALIEAKSRRWRPIAAALLAIPLVIGLTFYVMQDIKDEIRFRIWSHNHDYMLKAFANREAIILTWESWGFAGLENDSYLVSNPADNLRDAGARSEWLHLVQPACKDTDIVTTKRMDRGLYIVTTFNCPLQ